MRSSSKLRFEDASVPRKRAWGWWWGGGQFGCIPFTFFFFSLETLPTKGEGPGGAGLTEKKKRGHQQKTRVVGEGGGVGMWAGQEKLLAGSEVLDAGEDVGVPAGRPAARVGDGRVQLVRLHRPPLPRQRLADGLLASRRKTIVSVARRLPTAPSSNSGSLP